MLYKTILLAFILIYCFKGVPHLIAYFRLRRYGVKAAGNIESVKQTNWFTNWFWPFAPLVKFVTAAEKQVLKKPISSLATGNNEYKEGSPCIVYYSAKNPNKFIIESQIELKTNILLLFITVVFIIDFIFR